MTIQFTCKVKADTHSTSVYMPVNSMTSGLWNAETHQNLKTNNHKTLDPINLHTLSIKTSERYALLKLCRVLILSACISPNVDPSPKCQCCHSLVWRCSSVWLAASFEYYLLHTKSKQTNSSDAIMFLPSHMDTWKFCRLLLQAFISLILYLLMFHTSKRCTNLIDQTVKYVAVLGVHNRLMWMSKQMKIASSLH